MCKVVVEFKTPWAFKIRNLVEEYGRKQDKPTAKVVKLIQQVYGYMTFNHQRYGVVSTYDQTWYFRRMDSTTGGILEITDPIKRDSQNPYLLESLLTLLHLADESWFYVSPTTYSTSPAPIRKNLQVAMTVDP